MKIEIHSFNSIEKLAAKPFKSKTALISIGNPNGAMPILKHKPDYILRLEFDDCICDTSYLFNGEQARQIADFVLRHKDEIDLLICQCVYGISRSAGCAVAISEYLYGNCKDIHGNYSPNSLVCNKVFYALSAKKE